MENKIREIKILHVELEELKSFLNILQAGNNISTIDKRELNDFSFISLGVYIWTGKCRQLNEVTIRNKNVINKLKASMLEIVKQEIEIKELKLKELIK